jgi:hypothetical protein
MPPCVKLPEQRKLGASGFSAGEQEGFIFCSCAQVAEGITSALRRPDALVKPF